MKDYDINICVNVFYYLEGKSFRKITHTVAVLNNYLSYEYVLGNMTNILGVFPPHLGCEA